MAGSYYDMGQQVIHVAQGLPDKSSIALMVFEGERQSKLFKQLVRSLKKEGLSIQHVEWLRSDPATGWIEERSGFPYEEFLRIAGGHDVDAVVSLCGTPYLSSSTELPDWANLPQLLVTSEVQYPRRLDRLLAEGRVAAAVVPRDDEPSGDEPASPFEGNYQVIHSAAHE